VTVHNDSESSSVSNVKPKQDLDPVLVDLKKSVSEKRHRGFLPRGRL